MKLKTKNQVKQVLSHLAGEAGDVPLLVHGPERPVGDGLGAAGTARQDGGGVAGVAVGPPALLPVGQTPAERGRAPHTLGKQYCRVGSDFTLRYASCIVQILPVNERKKI